jgi:hypothetical protein
MSVSTGDGREEVDRLKASRKGFKAALTRTRRAVEELIHGHEDGEDPQVLEERFAIWTQRWNKFQDAEDSVLCHPEADAADADKDLDEHEDAYVRAQAQVITFRRHYDQAQAQPVVAPGVVPAGGWRGRR